jgi:hypothetical protein
MWPLVISHCGVSDNWGGLGISVAPRPITRCTPSVPQSPPTPNLVPPPPAAAAPGSTPVDPLSCRGRAIRNRGPESEGCQRRITGRREGTSRAEGRISCAAHGTVGMVGAQVGGVAEAAEPAFVVAGVLVRGGCERESGSLFSFRESQQRIVSTVGAHRVVFGYGLCHDRARHLGGADCALRCRVTVAHVLRENKTDR